MRLHMFSKVAMVAALSFLAFGCDEGEDEEDVDRSCKELESGQVCTWIGNPELGEGYNGDGHRRDTMINQPMDLLFMSDGTPYFTDFNNFLIRRVAADDTVETVVGSTDPVFPGDGPFTGITPEGAPGDEWLLNHPTNLLQNPDGTLLVVGWHNHKLLIVDPDSGHVRVMCGGGAGFAGDGGPAAMGALFRQLNDATFDEAGNIYILDQGNGRIRMIDGAGMLTSIAGDGMLGYAGDGGPALEAQFSWARGSNPNPSGGILYHQGMLYIADTEQDVIRVMDLQAGTINAFAGTGTAGDSGDGGPAISAQLNAPRDMEIGPEGDLYFADTDNGKVRAIELSSGTIRTVVGTGELGIDEDGLPATETRLRRPFGIAFDADDNLYVLDSLNNRIVKVAK
jgi:outer membrane protein assembly factor BamB